MSTEPAVRMQGARYLLSWAVGISLVLVAAMLLGSGAWVVLALVGVGFSAVGTNRILRARAARAWPQVPATVFGVTIKQHVEPENYSASVYHYPEIELWYEIGGNRYEVSTYGAVKGDYRSLEKEKAESAASKYKVGDVVQLYVAPENPGRAVLIPQMSAYAASSSWALVLGGIIVLALGIGVGVLNAL